ncbi:MAG: translesion DNA synthesis-associated protein ImuA [Oceanospirillaceae bacterium]|nr:translesion DNA synthesis-associated protein ImuA [Oceanospirillaceae bacterium]
MRMVLAELIQQGQVWRAHDAPARPAKALLATGFPELDSCLSGGWMPGQLIELLMDQPSSGELSLLLPLLAQVSQQPGLIIWVDPPMHPYPLALAQAGVRLRDHRVIRTQSLDERLWVLEQALKSGCAPIVMGWLEKVPTKALRRLQLAVQQGQGLAFILRSAEWASQSSPASFRLHLKAQAQGVKVDLLKRRQAWPTEGPLLALTGTDRRAL